MVDDGPTLTHGGMPFGAGTVAAKHGGALELVDPRPFAVGTIKDVLARYLEVDSLPAMGYSPVQLHELETTMNACSCDVVITGTPIDLGRLIESKHPIRHARYEPREFGLTDARKAARTARGEGNRTVLAPLEGAGEDGPARRGRPALARRLAIP